uniref:RecA/RadA recombinase-like protein (RAD51) n=1 Tax=uncultured marine thaumarchaeote KM3_01_F02 TaxID=1455952 RepID=A0A075G1W7_9ARCH|nr:RecA/RadA recombinase-like protein (RAD51) [uncultured marine thaumarchaeote KM3_01_F02]
MIETGLKKLDQFLGGGIKEGLITDISGQNSTGKTQLVFQICINALKNGKEILFQDTTGEFRPERLVEMLKIRKLDPILLDKIKVGRITNSVQQSKYLSKTTTNDFSLIVIDNATDLFSFEYSKKEQSLEKHLAFIKYMQNLASIAINTKIPIVVTNIVRSFNENEEENLEKSIGMFTHIKIRLKKNANGFQCQVVSPFINKKFQYNITSDGLTDGS